MHSIMKTVSAAFALICSLVFAATCQAQQPAAPPMQAEITRSTTGRGIDKAGFASIPFPLKKGAIYDVMRRVNAGVVVNVEGKDVMVPSGDVSLTEKVQAPPPSADGFTAGKIVLVSAKYTMDGNQPRNVKNRLQKLVPQGIITAPVEIFVNDSLSLAVQTQGKIIDGTISATSSTTANINLRVPTKNVLTVEYLFNGEKRTKQAPEGAKMVLP